ncbi:MAG: SDR family oxidoreductase [Gammaproteobacteria bacterium]|nr:MAG: SDR family oxidoreductase [Gammaproteobacteria bacterium]
MRFRSVCGEMIVMNKVMIVGCGYIGQRVARQLQRKGVPVTGFVNSQSSLDLCHQQQIDCHLFDLDKAWDSGYPYMDFSSSVILYTVPPQPAGEEDLRMRHFLELLRQHIPKKLVLISTTGVYGDCGGQWIDESTPLNPVVDRARRRFSSEQQAQTYCQNNHVALIILRVPGIYGPGKFPLERIRKGLPVVREQDSPFSNRIHAADLVTICVKAIEDDAIQGIYNCADGHPTTMFDYFMKVARAHGLPEPPAISLEQAKRELSPGMLSYMEESRRIGNAKLLRDFHITLQYPDLDAGLAECVKD